MIVVRLEPGILPLVRRSARLIGKLFHPRGLDLDRLEPRIVIFIGAVKESLCLEEQIKRRFDNAPCLMRSDTSVYISSHYRDSLPDCLRCRPYYASNSLHCKLLDDDPQGSRVTTNQTSQFVPSSANCRMFRRELPDFPQVLSPDRDSADGPSVLDVSTEQSARLSGASQAFPVCIS